MYNYLLFIQFLRRYGDRRRHWLSGDHQLRPDGGAGQIRIKAVREDGDLAKNRGHSAASYRSFVRIPTNISVPRAMVLARCGHLLCYFSHPGRYFHPA